MKYNQALIDLMDEISKRGMITKLRSEPFEKQIERMNIKQRRPLPAMKRQADKEASTLRAALKAGLLQVVKAPGMKNAPATDQLMLTVEGARVFYTAGFLMPKAIDWWDGWDGYVRSISDAIAFQPVEVDPDAKTGEIIDWCWDYNVAVNSCYANAFAIWVEKKSMVKFRLRWGQ